MTSLAKIAKITIASRESKLALVQTGMIRDRLAALHPGLVVEVLGMTTQGDQILDRPLAQIGGKGLFIKELETALADGRADIAVHSMKDMPAHLPPGFTLITVGDREAPEDAFVSNHHANLAALPQGAVVGTSSLRRECQLRLKYPHLRIESLRGNVGTRLSKLDEGRYDAIILAAAGLRRLGLGDRIRAVLAMDESLPAIGQGALAIEFREDRADVAALLEPLTHPDTTATVAAERALGATLLGSCDVPLGGHARIEGNGTLKLEGFIGLPDGSRHLRDAISGPPEDAASLGRALGERLLANGARAILDQLAAAKK
jgi:hydroxymethylbilane synthase